MRLIAALAIAAMGWWRLAGDCLGHGEQLAQDPELELKVSQARDAARQYERIQQHGSLMDRCLQAGKVKAAYQEAEDRAKYALWADVENADCLAAGQPH